MRILGNTTVSMAIVRNLIRTQMGDRFDPAVVQDDYQRVFDLKKFSNVEARVEPTANGGVIVVFDLTEQKLIKSVHFHGNRAVKTDTLKGDIGIKEGQAIDSFRIAQARQAIVNQYRDLNFPLAHVEVNGDALSLRGELVFEIVEGPHILIRKVGFIGNDSFDADKLKAEVKTAAWFPIFIPGKFDAELVDEDVAAVRRYYIAHGFFDAQVDRRLLYSPDLTEMEVDFVINEGRRYRVNRVSFEGNSRIGEVDLRRDTKLVPGKFFDQESMDRDIKEMVKVYSPLGYIYAPNSTDEDYLRIEAKPIFLGEPGKVDLLYAVHEGKSFRVGRIIVRGNHKSQDKLVEREFRDMAPGSLYNSGQVQDAQERLKALPYFAGVTVNPIGDDPQYRDLLVEVNEARTASFNIGAGINSNGGVGGNITYRQSNFDITNVPNDPRDLLAEHSFTGAGQQFVASFEPGTIATNASLRFTEPFVFDQPYSFTDEVYLRDRLREAYDDRRIGDRVTLGRRLDYIWSASVTARGEVAKIYQVLDERNRAEEILAGRGSHTITGAGFNIRRETTNPGPLPYKGTVTNFGYEYVGALGGEYFFHKLTLNWDGYQTVGEDLQERKTVIGLHGFTGYIPGESPFFERFYGGGIGSARGFRFRGIGPREGRGNDPIGGNFVVTGSAELNFPIFGESLRGVVFSDAADVESQASIGTIRTSVGTGIRLVLPFLGQAPLAIDFAVPISKSRQDESQLISFSLGFAQ